MSILDFVDSSVKPQAEDKPNIISFIHSAPDAAAAQIGLQHENNPDQAAEAINIGDATGVPPQTVMSQYDEFSKKYGVAQAAQLVGENPALVDYINSHPLAASVSKDDWATLDGLTKHISSFVKTVADDPFHAPLTPLKEAVKTFNQSMYDQGLPTSGVTPEYARAFPYSAALWWMLGLPLDVTGKVFKGVTDAAEAFVSSTAKQFGYDESSSGQMGREAAGLAEYVFLTGGMHAPEVPVEVAMQARINQIRDRISPFIQDGKDIPKGVVPELDAYRAEVSKQELDNLEEGLKLAQKSTTRERMPELLKNNLLTRIMGNYSIEVDAQAIRRIYGEKQPDPQDDILGWVPGITEELPLAEATNGTISIPYADWLTRVDPEVAKALQDDIRIGTNSMSRKEAEEFKEQYDTAQESWEDYQHQQEFIEADAKAPITDYKITHTIDEGKLGKTHTYEVQKEGSVLGTAEIKDGENFVSSINVDPKFRRQGVASLLYNHIEKDLGIKLRPADVQTPEAEAFWGARRKPRPEAEFSTNDTDVDTARDAMRLNPVFDEARRAKLNLIRDGQAVQGTGGKFHEFAFQDSTGKTFGHLQIYELDEGKTLEVSSIGAGEKDIQTDEYFATANAFGPRVIMDLLRQLRDEFPEAKTVTGIRVSGARKEAAWASVPLANPSYEDLVRISNAFRNRPNLADGSILPQEHEIGQGRTWRGNKVQYTFKLKDAIDKIEPNLFGGISKTIYEFFGQRLKDIVGDVPVHVISHEDMHKTLMQWYSHEGGDHGGRGFYMPADHAIILSEDYVNGVHSTGWTQTSIIHEGVHALTARYIEDNPEYAARIKQLRLHVADWVKKNLDPEMAAQFVYGLRNEDEFLAESFSRPKWHELLHQIELPAKLGNLVGLEKGKYTIWDAFRHILKDVYEKITGKRPGNNVMDAVLLATKEVEHKLLGLDQPDVFARAKELGMSQERYKLHMKAIEDRFKQDIEANISKIKDDERKRQTKEWKENRAALRPEVERDITSRPDVAAHLFMDRGVLHGAKLAARYKIDPKTMPEELAQFLPKQYFAKDGLDADLVAGLFGFKSKDAFVQSLGAYEDARAASGKSSTKFLQHIVDLETDRQMKEKYGNLDRNIVTGTMDRTFNQGQLDILHEQMLFMAEKAGAQLPLEGIENWIKDNFRQQRISSMTSTKLFNTIQRLGNKVHMAYLKQDWAEAFKLAQEQYRSAVVMKQVRDLEKKLGQFERTYKRMAKREPGNVPQEYANFIHVIYNMIGKPVRRSMQDLELALSKQEHSTLADFVTSHNQFAFKVLNEDNLIDDGFEIMPVAKFLYDGTFRPKEFDNLTVDEFTAIHNSIKTILQNGRNEKKFKLGAERWEMAILVERMLGQLERTLKEKDLSATVKDPGILRTSLAYLLNVESIMTRFDKGDPKGIFTQAIVRPAMEGMNAKAAMEREYAIKYRELGEIKGLKTKVANTVIPDPLYRDGRLMDMTRENVLAAVSWMGNESSRNKFFKGLLMDDGRKAAFMDWLYKNTTKEDWDRAQKLGDLFGELFEKAENMYQDLTGVLPERIRIDPIETPFGTYRGWYHPAIYDPLRAKEGARGLTPNVFDEGSFYRPQTAAGYAKARTGYAAPPWLSFEAIPRRMMQIINDINMRPAVTELSKLFHDGTFANGITRMFGQEFNPKNFLIPWLRDIAGQSIYKDAQQAAASRILNYYLHNTIATLIGFNPHTVVKHGLSAAMNSISKVGAKDFAEEFFTMFSKSDEQGESNWKFAMEKSQELQRRYRHWRETFGGAQDELFREGLFGTTTHETLRNTMIEFGSKPVALIDLASAVPSWLAVYKRVKREGGSEGDAIFQADAVVRDAHGSTAIASKPRVMRGGAVAQFATPLYGFFSRMFQNSYRIAWEGKDAIKAIKGGDLETGLKAIPHLMGSIWSFVIFPALVEQMITPILFPPGTSNTKKTVEVLARGTANQVPVLRDLVNAYIDNHDPSVGLYSTGFKAINDFGRDINKHQLGLSREHAGRTWKDFNVVLGILTGMTNAQIGKTGEFIYNYAAGKEHPKSLIPLTDNNWIDGLSRGTLRKPR